MASSDRVNVLQPRVCSQGSAEDHLTSSLQLDCSFGLEIFLPLEFYLRACSSYRQGVSYSHAWVNTIALSQNAIL